MNYAPRDKVKSFQINFKILGKPEPLPTSFPDFCVLCGRKEKLTEEHILADWVGRFLKKKLLYEDSLFTESTIRTKAGKVRSLHRGNFTDRKIPVLCDECNNVWGSKIQKKAGDILKTLIEGGWAKLSDLEQERVAKFATCYSMVSEFNEPTELRAIPQNVREQFRKTATIPRGWRVFIAPYTGEPTVFRQRKAFPKRFDSSGRALSFAEIFAMGRLAVYIFGTADDDLLDYFVTPSFALSRALRQEGLIQIWPIGIPFPENRPDSISDSNTELLLSTAYSALSGGIWE